MKKYFSLFFVGVVIFCAFTFLFPNNSSAATFYISPSGTDDGSHGTSSGAGAWKTLSYALTGSRVSSGDTVNMEAGTYNTFYSTNTNINPVMVNNGGGTVTVQAYPAGASVTVDVPATTGTSTGFFYFGAAWVDLTFKHINFTNSTGRGSHFIWMYGHNVTFEDCLIDYSNVPTSAGRYPFNLGASATDANITIRRSIVKSILSTTTAAPIIYDGAARTNTLNLTIESSEIYNGSNYLQYPFKATINNNTFINSYSYFWRLYQLGTTTSEFTLKNNIFYNPNVSDSTGGSYLGKCCFN